MLAYKKVINSSDSEVARLKSLEIIEFLCAAKDIPWETPTGLLSVLARDGFLDVHFRQVLPPAKVKGKFFQLLDSENWPADSKDANELSLAIGLSYMGAGVLLGADGVLENWLYQRHQADAAQQSFAASIVKLPHHGSKKDCREDVLDILFGISGKEPSDRKLIALISSNGKAHHPSPLVLAALQKKGILPYCTNLAKVCGGGKVQTLLNDSTISPSLRRFLNSVDNDLSRHGPTPCQGDIAVTIDAFGAVSVNRQFGNACAYRGDYAFA